MSSVEFSPIAVTELPLDANEATPRQSRRVAAVAGIVLATVAVVVLFAHGGSQSVAPAATELASAPCPGRPAPSGKLPEQVIKTLDEEWKLQLPCQTPTCSEDYATVLHACGKSPGCVRPGIASIFTSDLKNYQLLPRPYSVEGKDYCSGGFYAAKDQDGTDMVVLNDPVSGVTTGGSQNPRVELREMRSKDQPAGFTLTDDSITTNKNTLSFTQRIMKVPPTFQSVTFAQVFNGGTPAGPFIEVMTRLCQYSWQALTDGSKCKKGDLYIMVWIDGKAGGKGGMTLAPYKLGTKFDFHIAVPGDGTIEFTYKSEDGYTADWSTTCREGSPCSAANSDGVYFKTGAYVQNAPQEPSDSYVLSYLYKAKVTY